MNNAKNSKWLSNLDLPSASAVAFAVSYACSSSDSTHHESIKHGYSSNSVVLKHVYDIFHVGSVIVAVVSSQ